MKKVTKVLTIILWIFIVIGGISCIFSPGETFLMIGYVVGFSMILDAVAGFVNWWREKKEGNADGWMLTSAILSAVFGFFVVNSAILQLSLDLFIIYYIAAWMICRGIVVIVRANKLRMLHKNWNTKMVGTHWYLPLIIGILLILFGILSMINPQALASTLGIFIGFGVVSAGANLITFATTPEDPMDITV